jgi:hypothetical protein
MEATLGISLYRYLNLKLAKTMSFLLSLSFLFNKIREEGGTSPAQKTGEEGRGEVAQTMYTHVSKCKQDKRKREKKKKLQSF